MLQISFHSFAPLSKLQPIAPTNHDDVLPFSSPFYPPPPNLSPPLHQNNSFDSSVLPKNSKKMRNFKLPQKSEPSADKIRKINSRRGRYKRSTNNSHKKFICVARRLLVKLLSGRQRQDFQEQFQGLKNSRTYYFIILAHAKFQLSSSSLHHFRTHFVAAMNFKTQFYQKQVDRTDNRNFINFRFEQIADIRFALTAFQLYFDNRVEEAIEVIYKKDKPTVLKKPQYEQALEVVRELQYKLQLQREITNRDNELKITASIAEASNVASSKLPKLTSPFILCHQRGAQNQQQMLQRHKYPLLGLQKSYPIYDHFFPIVYPYTFDCSLGQNSAFQFLPSFNSFGQFNPMEEILKPNPPGKTDVDGEPQPWENNAAIGDMPPNINPHFMQYFPPKDLQFDKFPPIRQAEDQERPKAI